ncbi:MAG TPA: hypothetical protein PL033_16285 [Candidatus Brocadiia bacterium]|nr:hypothetical protein [Candidatus Brocadiia bacterium]
MSEKPFRVHSIAEENLFVILHPCVCGGQRIKKSQELVEENDKLCDEVTLQCGQCGETSKMLFDVSGIVGRIPQFDSINPTSDPSEVIDVVQWLDLAAFHFSTLQDNLSKMEDQEKSYFSAIALQSVDEALKFYPPNGRFPLPFSPFSEEGRQLIKEKKDFFAREAVDELRAGIKNFIEKNGIEPKILPKGPIWSGPLPESVDEEPEE